MFRDHWREKAFWAWWWRNRVNPGVKAILALVGLVALGGAGMALADTLAENESIVADVAFATVGEKTVTVKEKGRTVVKSVPLVKTVRVISAETSAVTSTERYVSTITTGGRTRVVTNVETIEVPVVKKVVVTGPPTTDTVMRTQTERSTVTNQSTVTNTRTETALRTETNTQTQTVTRTQTSTVTQPPVTNTLTVTNTQTVTLTFPLPPITTVTVTITKPK